MNVEGRILGLEGRVQQGWSEQGDGAGAGSKEKKPKPSVGKATKKRASL